MRLLLGFLLFAGLAARGEEPAVMRYSRPAVRKELVAVVAGQLAAFRADDFARAYEFAARALRDQFTLEEFAGMIARGYPLIRRNARADFGLPMDDGTQATMTVEVSAPGGSAAYRYTFVKEPAGWRISGVQPEKPRASDA